MSAVQSFWSATPAKGAFDSQRGHNAQVENSWSRRSYSYQKFMWDIWVGMIPLEKGGAEPGSRLHEKGCQYQGRGHRALDTYPTWLGKGQSERPWQAAITQPENWKAAASWWGGDSYVSALGTPSHRATDLTEGCISCLSCTRVPGHHTHCMCC